LSLAAIEFLVSDRPCSFSRSASCSFRDWRSRSAAGTVSVRSKLTWCKSSRRGGAHDARNRVQETALYPRASLLSRRTRGSWLDGRLAWRQRPSPRALSLILNRDASARYALAKRRGGEWMMRRGGFISIIFSVAVVVAGLAYGQPSGSGPPGGGPQGPSATCSQQGAFCQSSCTSVNKPTRCISGCQQALQNCLQTGMWVRPDGLGSFSRKRE
jgi:hypothetical protein